MEILLLSRGGDKGKKLTVCLLLPLTGIVYGIKGTAHTSLGTPHGTFGQQEDAGSWC